MDDWIGTLPVELGVASGHGGRADAVVLCGSQRWMVGVGRYGGAPVYSSCCVERAVPRRRNARASLNTNGIVDRGRKRIQHGGSTPPDSITQMRECGVTASPASSRSQALRLQRGQKIRG